ncbi:hypothetical protein FMUBM48_45210 [Nocardia cyriacigeorgica]|nr:hypothetical protein FMUBM48_45210 [Nocardia cyriacigeorgica]
MRALEGEQAGGAGVDERAGTVDRSVRARIQLQIEQHQLIQPHGGGPDGRMDRIGRANARRRAGTLCERADPDPAPGVVR